MKSASSCASGSAAAQLPLVVVSEITICNVSPRATLSLFVVRTGTSFAERSHSRIPTGASSAYAKSVLFTTRTGSDSVPAGTGSANSATDHQPLYTVMLSSGPASLEGIGYRARPRSDRKSGKLWQRACERTCKEYRICLHGPAQSRKSVAITRSVRGKAGVKSTSSQPKNGRRKRPSLDLVQGAPCYHR